ncbi:LOW QUALITY PROTEIN: paralemmin-3 [Anarrhichthys ocellatus]|uniref:LOW QUALITY PROTEIN: paralemmin-3 n=1 Tax=Anarrhichthys ocellatus TaxID=433405 RepID=UPI0012EDCD80|nr:LOW QUALITY PROTEIN: paralemmin-3 [Anarrhichthys ocellatus]
MEDEKLRLQQLKRKSLRDQWLMDGPPLSPIAPASPEAQSPRSPLWGSQAQEIEKRIDKLQSESQRLAEEEESLKEQMEDGQTEAVKKAEAGAEMVQDAVMQNGENNGSDEAKTKSTPLGETAAVLTNGEADTNHDTRASTNGPVEASGGGMKSEPGLSFGVSEAELSQVPNVNFNEEEEGEGGGGILVMRAERVIITEDGDDVPEDLAHQQETMQTEAAGQEGGQAEGEVKTEAAPETFTQQEQSEATEPAAEEQWATGDGDSQGGVEKNGDGERKSEGGDKDSEGPTSAQVQSPAGALEGTAVASLPVYSEAQPAALAPELEAEGEAATSPEGAEAALKAQVPAEGEAATSPEGAKAALKAQVPAAPPGQFQEVPLADPQESQRTEARPGEREPLLSQAKTNNAQAEPAAAAAASASTETYSSARAGHGEEAEAPKHKACQCCSVM